MLTRLLFRLFGLDARESDLAQRAADWWAEQLPPAIDAERRSHFRDTLGEIIYEQMRRGWVTLEHDYRPEGFLADAHRVAGLPSSLDGKPLWGKKARMHVYRDKYICKLGYSHPWKEYR